MRKKVRNVRAVGHDCQLGSSSLVLWPRARAEALGASGRLASASVVLALGSDHLGGGVDAGRGLEEEGR